MTHGSLFDGAGGMRIGLEEVGFQTVWTRDILYEQDITDPKYDPKESVDLISGGPPCTQVSTAGTFSGTRTLESLWSGMLRVCKELRPNWVLVEQPKGGKSVIFQAASDLQRLGYGCAGRVINSQHWLPQRRLRWYLVGRLGVSGLALWDLLYPDRERMEGRECGSEVSPTEETSFTGLRYTGSCPDCLRGGVFARISSRIPALVGAGNAVSIPVARWLGEKIQEAERKINART